MELRVAVGAAIREVRLSKGLSQEMVGPRAYQSALERGVQCPTVEKLHEIASIMDVHPLTLVGLAYEGFDRTSAAELFAAVLKEIETVRAR